MPNNVYLTFQNLISFSTKSQQQIIPLILGATNNFEKGFSRLSLTFHPWAMFEWFIFNVPLQYSLILLELLCNMTASH